MKLVHVIWEDACEESGTWIEVEGAKPVPPKIFEQVGWLYRHTDTEIELTHTVEPDHKGLMAPRDRIPRGMVRSIRTLQVSGANLAPPKRKATQ